MKQSRTIVIWIVFGIILVGLTIYDSRRSKSVHQIFQHVCLDAIGDGKEMEKAVSTVLWKYKLLQDPPLREHVIRGPVILQTRYYGIPSGGRLMTSQDGSYCQIFVGEDEGMDVLEGVANFDEMEFLRDNVNANGFRRAVIRMKESGAIVNLVEGSAADFLHIMTPELYMRQRAFDDPEVAVDN
ncbi:hypothetical protein [Thalassospira sp. ER-Se-21-Dark]|uniref:hypothetical protein n=1 Tax=Thalassospira sp. ER-Se-21-Dark TaxID=2585190 RepID=UPI001B301A86|nr:hypothetical protein [Thalassospira sp. ER-Se-21-Dark]MBP3127307.1 hypothetical protein [Thalassospira sp. ER-Se-21-Dark]